jgi:hypothetical protein
MSSPLFDRLDCLCEFLITGPIFSIVRVLDVSIDLVTDITCPVDKYVGHLPIAPETRNVMAQSIYEVFDKLGGRIKVISEFGEVSEQSRLHGFRERWINRLTSRGWLGTTGWAPSVGTSYSPYYCPLNGMEQIPCTTCYGKRLFVQRCRRYRRHGAAALTKCRQMS